MKFKFGKLDAMGERTTEDIVEYDCWFDAIESALASVGLYLIELDEEGNEVV